MMWERSTFTCNCLNKKNRYTVLIENKDESPGYKAGSKVRCDECGRTGIVDDDAESCWVHWDY
jgi:hypothetical protein